MRRAFQWDLARQVERFDWLLAQLPRYADWGYEELYLHLEDAVEYPSLPRVARADAYSARQMDRLVATALRCGIRVVPIVNLLGHTQYLIKVPELRDLNELRTERGAPRETGQICPVHPRTLEVADALLRDVTPWCTAGKVHVGLDESFHLGKHPLSQREIADIGLAAHFARYVGRLRDLARTRGLATGMWADMLYFIPGAIPLLPRDVAVYEWYYYGFRRRPRVELFNFAESDVGEQLVAHGHEYWGCPMNGAFRFEPLPHFGDRLGNILDWWRRCHQLGAAGMLVTSWEPYRLAIELTTVVDAAAASLWLDGITETREMLARGFARAFGASRTAPRRAPTEATTARSSQQPSPASALPRAALTQGARLADLVLECDRFPFSGYPRWEINTRWDVISRREPLAPYRAEARHFQALGERASRVAAPAPLRDSIAFRAYLAARDVWVREAQQGRGDAAAFRASWSAGVRAARAMWRRTRDPRVVSPNERILREDAARLRAWQRGEPIFGPEWQLCYAVRNVAPAAQLVLVEQRQDDGGWQRLQACHTIEFQSRSAVRRGGLTREHAAPAVWDGATPLTLRIRAEGGGEVVLERVELRSKFGSSIPLVRTAMIGSHSLSAGLPRPSTPENRFLLLEVWAEGTQKKAGAAAPAS